MMTVWYGCPYCDESFNSIEELALHRDKEHPGKQIFACKSCEKTFKNYGDATDHLVWDHNKYGGDYEAERYIFAVFYIPPETKKEITEINKQISVLAAKRSALMKELSLKLNPNQVSFDQLLKSTTREEEQP